MNEKTSKNRHIPSAPLAEQSSGKTLFRVSMIPRSSLDLLIGHMLEEAGAEAGLQSHVAALVGAQSPEAVCQGPLAESRGLALTTNFC